MLRWRLLLGAVFIAGVAALVRFDAHAEQPGSWLYWLAVVLALAAAGEAIALVEAAGIEPLSAAIYAGTLLVVASNAVPLFLRDVPEEIPLERLAWPLLGFALAVILAFIDAMRRYRAPGGVTAQIAAAVLVVAYVGLMLSFAVQLRLLGGPTLGLVGLAAMIIVVKFGDIGAYTVGRLIGRHKMAPLISPGKTMEGAAGAIVFACLGAWLSFTYLPPAFGVTEVINEWAWLPFGVIVGAAGMLGDLAESLLKRDAGKKDSSSWLPGFGGVLDLLDSILFAAPVAYLCWLVIVE